MPHWGFLSPQKVLAVGIAIVFAYINFRGASETGKIGNFVTLTKIVILTIFIGFGIEMMIHRGNWQEAFTPFMPNGWGGVVKAMGLTFIAFQGFEVISQASEEIKNPKKNIPRAVFLSLMIVVPIYLLIAVTALGTVQSEGMTPWDFLALKKETALVEVAKTFFSGGGIMLLFGGLISTMSALNATVYSSSRVAFAMGRDRNFPTFFGKVHPKKFTPHFAIVFSLLIVIGMSVSLNIEDVASAADIMFLLLFLQVNVTLIRLRKKRPDLDRGFFTPLFPYLTIVGILLLLFLAVYMFDYSPLGWLVTGVWIGIGLVVYRTYASDREIEHIQRVAALESLERQEYRILVALADDAAAMSLSNIAMAVASRNGAEIVFLHVIEVKEGQPLRAGLDEYARASEFLERATEFARRKGANVRSLVKVAHRISQGIVETAEEEHCNFILLGRQKDPEFLERLFSSVIDSVIQDSPCEVAVLHGKLPSKGVKKIMIPFAYDIHTRLAVEITPALAKYFRSQVQIGVVMDPEDSTARHMERMMKIQKLIAGHDLKAKIEVTEHEGVLNGIKRLSKNVDLLVMAGRTGDFLELLLRRSLSQEITEEVACPVLWVKEFEERPSFLSTLFSPMKKEGVEHHG